MGAVQVDERYRVTIPKELRESVRPGDVLFVERTEDHGVPVYRYAKAENPFDVLAGHALMEYRAGKTVGLDEVFADDDAAAEGAR
jgi:AbrB family looped-hinge helix DNA binding protein